MSLIETAVEGRVAVITLHDPPRRNAMSLAMSRELSTAVDDLRSRDVGAVIVTGTPPAFSAGADLGDLEQADEDRLRAIYGGFLAVARFPRLTIAAVNGPAVGAGLNLALACDLRVAARSARFDCRFLQLALHPGGGHTWMLRQLLGPQGAAAMLLGGEALDGPEAERRGLAWQCVEDADLLARARALAAACAEAPADAVASFKGSLQAMAAVGDHGRAVELELQPQLQATRTEVFQQRLAALRRRISRSSSSR